MSNIKLYGYSTSPFVRKVGCFLYYKQQSFEFVGVSPVDPTALSFTDQTQVPVLSIDDQWRKDSTPLGLWIDELFPEKPLLGNNEKEKEIILNIDKWLSERFIPSMFRSVVERETSFATRNLAWRLASIVSSQSPVPDEIKNAWPERLKQAPFILEMIKDLDPTESLEELRINLPKELITHLNGGPYMGGLEQPSLADLAIFPQLVFGFMVGLEANLSVAIFPEIKAWLDRMRKHLPDNPILVHDYMVINPLEHAFIQTQNMTLASKLQQFAFNSFGSDKVLEILSVYKKMT